jgi:hypothetical protein
VCSSDLYKRQGTLFNFGVKKSRIEGVCDATSSDSSTSSLHSDLQDVQNKGKTNLNVILCLSECHTVYISVLILIIML